jgi:hypothetical protein
MRRLATQMVRWVAQRRAGSEQDRGLDHFVRAAVAIGRNGWDRTFAITPCGIALLPFLLTDICILLTVSYIAAFALWMRFILRLKETL